MHRHAGHVSHRGKKGPLAVLMFRVVAETAKDGRDSHRRPLLGRNVPTHGPMAAVRTTADRTHSAATLGGSPPITDLPPI